ncbi:hypothetical protein OHAE_1379 [Ochrobactrum soli]|uniref:Uncharacterized protein n=1 Tax=Ochrobactrum soli TaxID=2448455 RepID=A0A2P9HN40_9HYPH|nr:hypothetical protein OHAE_1379 [[Ochrobactrum] soli]
MSSMEAQLSGSETCSAHPVIAAASSGAGPKQKRRLQRI